MPKWNGDRGWAAAAVLVAICTAGSHAGSAKADPLRIIDHLYATTFVTAELGWVAGGFGSIYQTRDGGHTWVAQASHSVEQLFGISFADERHGWAVGRTGVILHTANGGSRWEVQKSGTDKHLFHVAALGESSAVAVGDWGAIVITRDGGAHWQDHSLDRDVILYAQSWFDAQNGWIVGETGLVLRTTDGGASWQDQPSGIEKTLFGVHFADPQRGWACGLDGLILHTADGGATWRVQRGEGRIDTLEQIGVAEALENASLYDIGVLGQRGYAVGDIGSIFQTEDGGETWHRKPVPPELKLGWLRALALLPSGNGLVVGAHGTTMRVAGDQIQRVGAN